MALRSVATSPSLSGAVWLSARFKLRASASRAFRLPSFTDLYYHDPGNVGNPLLKPESATSYEAGIDAFITPALHASLTVFHRRDSNVIDFVRPDPTALYQATNFDRLHFTGVEASAAWKQLSISFSALHGLNASPEILTSKYTFNYPLQQGAIEWRGSRRPGRYRQRHSRAHAHRHREPGGARAPMPSGMLRRATARAAFVRICN